MEKRTGKISLNSPLDWYNTTDNLAVSQGVAYLFIYDKGAELVALDTTD